MSDELILKGEDIGREMLKRIRGVSDKEPVFLSGRKLDDTLGFDQFIAAWHMDRASGSLSPQYIEALKTFVLNWKLSGQEGFKVPVRVRNKVTGEEMEIECETDKMPDFSYNKQGVRNIGDLYLTYQDWMDAVADLKLNLSGPSRGTAQSEMNNMGGTVDASEDVVLPDLDGLDALDKALE